MKKTIAVIEKRILRMLKSVIDLKENSHVFENKQYLHLYDMKSANSLG